jgi:flavodoxin
MMYLKKGVDRVDDNKENLDNSPKESWEREDLSRERKEREAQEKAIENFVKTINEKLLKLLSDHNDLLYNIQNKINKIPKKENQLFCVCWIIGWETAKYFKGKNIFYEKVLKPFIDKYVFAVNLAKQKLSAAKFCEFYSDLVNKIEESETETPKPTNTVYYADKKTFRPSV